MAFPPQLALHKRQSTAAPPRADASGAVAFARAQKILCQGRGSAANSAVCYCLGITEVNPAQSTLLFERFISKERNEPPDIDVDFEHQRREEIIQYLYTKYGRHRAALAAAVATYHPRSAIRDVGKALGFDLATVDAIAKGQKYLTVVLDLDTGCVVFVGDGNGAEALQPFWRRLRRIARLRRKTAA